MAREQNDEIIIRLDTIRNLFVAGDNPFSDRIEFVSGIEYLKSKLIARKLQPKDQIKAIIVLPTIDEEITNTTQNGELTSNVVQQALQRYCYFRLQQNKNINMQLLKDSLNALLFGIVFLIVGLFIAQSIANLPVPPLLSNLLSDGFNIAFWVILWRPADVLLFELPAYKRESRVYEYMRNMEIIVRKDTQQE